VTVKRWADVFVLRFNMMYFELKDFVLYRVYQKNRNLGISQEIDIVLMTKDFRRLGI
jgi:hypothetical protein